LQYIAAVQADVRARHRELQIGQTQLPAVQMKRAPKIGRDAGVVIRRIALRAMTQAAILLCTSGLVNLTPPRPNVPSQLQPVDHIRTSRRDLYLRVKPDSPGHRRIRALHRKP